MLKTESVRGFVNELQVALVTIIHKLSNPLLFYHGINDFSSTIFIFFLLNHNIYVLVYKKIKVFN